MEFAEPHSQIVDRLLKVIKSEFINKYDLMMVIDLLNDNETGGEIIFQLIQELR